MIGVEQNISPSNCATFCAGHRKMLNLNGETDFSQVNLEICLNTPIVR